MILDLHKQVTKTAGGYQVKNVNNAMMLNIGGSATSNYVFIVRKA
jgi:acetyl-CoA C-acetyltransferase